MNDIRIAISAPMTVPMDHLSEVGKLLNDKYGIPYRFISFWDRTSAYNQRAFESANAVIVIADSKFGFNCKDLAPGVSKELTEAYYNSKPIFVAYKNSSNGQINFYSVDLKSGNGVMKVTGFSGIQRTSGKGGVFEKLLDHYVSFDDKPTEYTAKQRLQKHNGIDAQAELEKMINQDELEKAAIRLMQNSTYGIRCVDPSYNSEQIKFPEVRRVYASLIDNPDYIDNRLLLML
jgi:hypothetical protein